MSWVNVGMAAVSVAGGAYSANQSGRAADAQVSATKRGLAEQQRQYNTSMQMLEPNRYLGYQAADDLARLYGYGMSGYQPANMLLQGGGGGAGVKGITSSTSLGSGLASDLGGGPLGLGAVTGDNALKYFSGPEVQQYGGNINALAGTVDAAGAGPRKDALLTDYLRTGEWGGGKGGKMRDLRSAIDRLRAQGYEYGPSGASMPGTVAPRPAGEPGDMSRFFTSPDYEFRKSEGMRGVLNAVGGSRSPVGGAALKALADFNSNLASGEFGNYRNALFNMMGLGQTATTQALGAGQSAANNMTGLYGARGDARASGVMGSANSITGGINSGMNALLLNKYLNNMGSSSTAPAFSNYGPWASGYRFGG